MSIAQNRSAMFIRGAQELELRDLLRTIAFFASPDFRSFNADAVPWGGVRDEALLRRLRTILDRSVPEPDVEAFRAREVTVKSIDALAIVYRDGALRYILDGEPLDIQPIGFMPVRIGPRYLLQDGNDVVAVENGAEVARHALPPSGNGPHECWEAQHPRVLPQWVNFHCGGSTRVLLTYSLARNSFLRVSVELDPGWIHAARCQDGLFVGECG